MKERYLIITIVALAALLLAVCYSLMEMRLDHMREMRARAEAEARFLSEINGKLEHGVGVMEGLAVSMSPYPKPVPKVAGK